MALSDTINSIKQHIEDAYGIVEEKGGTIPDNKNLENMADSIGSISGGGEKEFTGHYDTVGLKDIGYDNETINWYQQHGVTWNESEDNAFVLSDRDKSYYGLTETDIIQGNTSRTKKQSSMFYVPMFDITTTSLNNGFYGYYAMKTIPLLDTHSVTNMTNMFTSCYALTTIPLLNTGSVTNMGYMFTSCRSLKTIPQLNTENVAIMNYMFQDCYSLKTIPQLNTEKAVTMTYMFQNCYSLTTIPLLDTHLVTNMSYMFNSCRSLTTIPQLNTEKVTNMNYMFQDCYSLRKVSLSSSPNLANMSYMFNNCYALRKVSLSSSPKLTNMNYTFNNCYTLEEIDLSLIDLTKVTSFGNTFNNCGSQLPSGQLTKVYVKDEASQNWVLTNTNGHPSTWSTANVIIAGSDDDNRNLES